jgi:hypothetical protein
MLAVHSKCVLTVGENPASVAAVSLATESDYVLLIEVLRLSMHNLASDGIIGAYRRECHMQTSMNGNSVSGINVSCDLEIQARIMTGDDNTGCAMQIVHYCFTRTEREKNE